MELVAPAGSFPALKAAVDNGADAVYIGFRNGANARNFPGLNFSPEEAAAAITYAHDRGVKVFCAINTHPDAAQWHVATGTVDQAARLGVDALMDMGRTSVNLIGNCLASAVVARWEGEFDDEKAAA